MKIAVITGVNGQLGSFLAELLLSKDDQYSKVIGTIRRTASPDYSNMDNFINSDRFKLEEMDLSCSGSINRVISYYKPDEFYNLAAQSHVASSWNQPISTSDINYMGVIRELEAIRLFSPKTKFYQMSTSEVIGDSKDQDQCVTTVPSPRSPYGCAKAASELAVKVWHDSYGLFACYARAFNMESSRRGKLFLTRKVTDAIGKMVAISNQLDLTLEEALEKGFIEAIKLGNINSMRDWQHAKGVAEGIWSMMQLKSPENYTFATGESKTVEQFVKAAFNSIGVKNYKKFIKVDESLIRPAEVDFLKGNYSDAENDLGWKPYGTFEDLTKEMVENDINIWCQKLGVKHVQGSRGLQLSEV